MSSSKAGRRRSAAATGVLGVLRRVKAGERALRCTALLDHSSCSNHQRVQHKTFAELMACDGVMVGPSPLRASGTPRWWVGAPQ